MAAYEERQSIQSTGEKPKETLLNITGGLMIGRPDSLLVEGTLKSIETHSLDHQIFSSNELQQRFPIMTPSPDTIGVFETEAGYLIPEACISTYLDLAESSGAVIHLHETFHSWTEYSPEVIQINTSCGKYFTKKLILSVGSWAPQIYGSEISLKLHCERRVLFWFRPEKREDYEFFQVALTLHHSNSDRNFRYISGTHVHPRVSSTDSQCNLDFLMIVPRLLFISPPLHVGLRRSMKSIPIFVLQKQYLVM